MTSYANGQTSPDVGRPGDIARAMRSRIDGSCLGLLAGLLAGCAPQQAPVPTAHTPTHVPLKEYYLVGAKLPIKHRVWNLDCSSTGKVLALYTGARHQDRGKVSLLDAESKRMLASWRLPDYVSVGGLCVGRDLKSVLVYAKWVGVCRLSVGASGAVSAVLGAYILKFPRARVRTLMFIFIFVTVINVPAVAFIGIWFFLQVLSSLAGPLAGVAWFAHIGGFVFGLIFLKVFEKSEKKHRYRVY